MPNKEYWIGLGLVVIGFVSFRFAHATPTEFGITALAGFLFVIMNEIKELKEACLRKAPVPTNSS